VRPLCFTLAKAGTPRQPASVYKWLYPKSYGGSDGLVPTKSLVEVQKAARLAGIILTFEDLDPLRP
jgi:hypothetical protein